MKKVFSKYMFYILCFIPTFLVAGPAIPDIIISLTSLFLFTILIKIENIFFSKIKYFIATFYFG